MYYATIISLIFINAQLNLRYLPEQCTNNHATNFLNLFQTDIKIIGIKNYLFILIVAFRLVFSLTLLLILGLTFLNKLEC